MLSVGFLLALIWVSLVSGKLRELQESTQRLRHEAALFGTSSGSILRAGSEEDRVDKPGHNHILHMTP